MITDMLDDRFQPTDKFHKMVESMTRQLIDQRKAAGREEVGDFFVTATLNKEHRVQYWGVIDFETIPEEDLYYEIGSRFYCATRTMGERNIGGYGLLDIQSVVSREPLVRWDGNQI